MANMEKLRILIVDDIYTNRLLLSVLIKSTGNEPVFAEHGERAIEILNNEKIHLVFMDIEMPILDGLATTRFIRNNMDPPLNSIPIIALTAHNPDHFFEDFSGVGFDELISKPYSADKIKTIINNLVK